MDGLLLTPMPAEISDDGSGFDSDAARGLGLAGMRERVAHQRRTADGQRRQSRVRAVLLLSELDETVVQGISHQIGA